jgi:uncharacterized membrane-anchored protein YhcB (DUF1043 family)
VSAGLPWPYVWIIIGVLAGLLLGVFVALLLLRHSVRSVADLQREVVSEQIVEQREADAGRAAAGRDDQREG